MKEHCEQLSTDLACSFNKIFIEALDKHCPGWTIDTIKNKCKLVKFGMYANGPEFLHLDGVAIAEIHPLRVSYDRTENSYIVRATIPYKIY